MIGGLVFTAILVVAVAAWLWRRGRPARAAGDGDDGPKGFTLWLADGRIVRTRGVVSRTVYDAFAEIADLSQASGTIAWDPEDGLSFGESIPDGVKQQFRNVFGVARVH